MIGQNVGAQNKAQAARTIGNTVTLFMLVAGALTAGLLLDVRPIVAVMSTPVEAVSGTVSYLTICFIGIPFITAYNIISSIFKLMDFIAANKLEITGFSREITMIDFGITDDPSQFVTEIRIPVKQAGSPE